jgi:light-regulated signal transduction histidine kinase (bacteriophytochrome)
LADAQTGLLDVLHDPVRLAKQITTIANNMARAGAPADLPLNRVIENAPPDLKTLVKASEMLSDSFSLLTIYMNPEAATYGRQTATNLHGLTTKIVSILRTNEDPIPQGWLDIRITGSCLKNVTIYESFKLIPFALLTNAIKYSPPGRPIVVAINDVSTGGVEVSVTSTGPLIEFAERDKIFQKNFRGKWASTYEGRGVGLYLADIVAKAHRTKIDVVSTDLRERVREIPIATNRFSVRVVS